MKKGVVIGIIILFIILLGAGYFIIQNKPSTNNDGQNSNIFTPTTTSKEPSELVLSVTDFPEGYTLKEKMPRVMSDVSEEGISLGWKKGYTATYEKEDYFTTITQSISIYPLENISKVIEPKVSDEEVTVEYIEIERIGDKSNAYKLTTSEELWEGEKLEVVEYEIEFIKKDVYESFTIFGSSKDFELLTNLAKKSADKI